MLLKSLFVLTILAIALAQANSINMDEFATDALFAHNLYRKIHGVPAIMLNQRLNEIARHRSQELANASLLSVKQNKFDGQNLGETVGSVGGFTTYNGISATQLWYSVVSKFDEEGESSNNGASFTQIVWKSTREVGFGISKSKDGKFFFVAEYFPSGNIRGQYEKNVFQLSDEELTKSCIAKEKMPAAASTIAIATGATTMAALDKAEHTIDTPIIKKNENMLIKNVKSGKKIAAATTTTVEPEIISTTTPFVSVEEIMTTTAAEIIDETTTTVLPIESITVAAVEETTFAPTRLQQIVKAAKKPIVAETTTIVDDTMFHEEFTTVRPIVHKVVKTTAVPIRTTTTLPVIEETTTFVAVEETTTVAVPIVEETTTAVVEETTTIVEEIATTPALPIETTTPFEEITATTEVLPVEENTSTIVLPTTKLQAIIKKFRVHPATTTTTVASDLSHEDSNIDMRQPETTTTVDAASIAIEETTTFVAPIAIKNKVTMPIAAVTEESATTEEITESAFELTTLKPTVSEKLIAKLKNKPAKVLLEQPVVQKSEPAGKFSFNKSE